MFRAALYSATLVKRMRLIRWSFFALLAIGGAHAQTDLENLNRAVNPAAYAAERLGKAASLDPTGSVSVSFGEGSPHTLIVAGLDAPGYIVSGITDDGYLRLQRVAEPPPGYQFDSLWPGQPIEVLRWNREPLAGVVLAPSVHFASDRSGYSGGGTLEKLYVDVGAASAEELAQAGVAVLDRVRLAIEPARLGAGAVTGPWLSSQAGGAILLALADHLAKSAPTPGRTTLVFANSQQYHNQGLLHALRRERPDQIVVLRPGGDRGLEVAAAGERAGELLGALDDHAKELEIDLNRSGSARLSFGPFEGGSQWPAPAATLTLGPRNEGTPAEILTWQGLSEAARLLAGLLGAPAADWETALRQPRPLPKKDDIAESSDELFELLADLVELPGVSGAEEPIREAIRQRLPAWAAQDATVDDAGNLIVPLGRPGKPRALFIAHMDEIGFEISRIDSTGRLSLTSKGGLSDELYAFRPLRLWTEDGPVPAVMQRTGSALLTVDSEESARELGASVGATLTPPKKLRRLLGGRINGRSLDDRAGCATLLLALQQLSEKSRAGQPVWVVFSAAEEVGLIGAEAIAKTAAPERVYAVDSLVTSDSPLEPKRLGLLRLGDGAALRAMDNSGITPRAEVERVAAMAGNAKIPLQIGVTAGGNDGSKFVQYGAFNIPLSFPLRSSHTSAETADLADLRALTDLITLLLGDELGVR